MFNALTARLYQQVIYVRFHHFYNKTKTPLYQGVIP